MTQKQTEELMDTIITRGVSIPRLGFGTFRMPGGGCQPVVESAARARLSPSRYGRHVRKRGRCRRCDRRPAEGLRHVTPPFAPDWNALTL
jgi:hypothetical protein